MTTRIQQIRLARQRLTEFRSLKDTKEEEFAADGIDADERRQLDEIQGNINAVQARLDELEAVWKANRDRFFAREGEYQELQSRWSELADWGHPDAGIVGEEIGAIAGPANEEDFQAALSALDQAATSMGPVWEAYQTQRAAQEAFEPLRAEVGTRLAAARAADPVNEAITAHLSQIDTNLPAVDDHVGARDYVGALDLVREVERTMGEAEAAISLLASQKAEFDTAWSRIEPRIADVSVSEYPELHEMQVELARAQGEIETAATASDYAMALSLLPDFTAKVETMERVLDENRGERDLYDRRLSQIQGELNEAAQCEFPALLPQQQEIDAVRGRMEAAAAGNDFEQALVEMDALVPLLDAFGQALENARLGQQYAELLAELEPRIAATQVSNYGPLAALAEEIGADHTRAGTAAANADYEGAIGILEGLRTKLDAYDARLAEIEEAKAEYEARYPAFAQSFGQLQSEHAEQAGDHLQIVELHDRMQSQADVGDFPAAVATLGEAEQLLRRILDRDSELDAARDDYERRIGDLTRRLDAQQVSDFRELEEPRNGLQSMRADMESAAANNDYGAALEHMNAVESRLAEIEDRQGELIELQRRYEEAYAQIRSRLERVEQNDAEAMAPKKDEILGIRDEMLAAAEATDFETAFDRCTALSPLIDEFFRLDALREDYARRLALVEPRVETVRGYAFKSLEDDKGEILRLFDGMQEKAAAADFDGAIADMGTLETKLGEIEAKFEALEEAKIGYEALLTVLDPKMAVVRANTAEEAQEAADAAIEIDDEMRRLAGEDEFIQALEKARELDGAIDRYQDALTEVEGGPQAEYEAQSPLVLAELEQARRRAEEFPETLQGDYDGMKSLGDSMESDAGGGHYEAALEKLGDLRGRLSGFEQGYLDVRDKKARFDTAIGQAQSRYDAFDSDEAEEKASGPYERADSYLDDARGEAEDENFDAAMEHIERANSEMDEVADALKTQEEFQREYDSAKARLEPRVTAARDSIFAVQLRHELGEVNDDWDDFTGPAENGDFEGAMDEVGDVESALTAFNAAEDEWEQKKVRYEERMQGLERPYALAMEQAQEHISLVTRVARLVTLKSLAETAAGGGDYDEALVQSQALSDEVYAILEEAEALDDAAAEEEDDGVTDWIADRARDLVDGAEELGRDIADLPETVSEAIEGDYGVVGEFLENAAQSVLEHVADPVADRVGGAVEHGASGARNLGEAAGDLVDGEFADAAKNVGEAVSDIDDALGEVSPLPTPGDVLREVAETVKDPRGNLVEEYEEIKQDVEDVFDTAKEVYERGGEILDGYDRDFPDEDEEAPRG